MENKTFFEKNIKKNKENLVLKDALNIVNDLVSKTNNNDLKAWVKIKKELEEIKKVYTEKKWSVEYFSVFFKDLEKVEEEDLVKIKERNLIDEKTFNTLKEIEEKIFLLSNKEDFNSFDLELLSLLKEAKIEIFEQIQEKYEIKKDKVLLNLNNFYQDKITKLEKKLKEIEEKPELKKEIKEIREKENEKLKELISLIKENVISLETKNNRAFSFIANYLAEFFFKEFLIGNKEKVKIDSQFVKEKILEYYNEDSADKERYLIEKNFYNKLREKIAQLILEDKIEYEWEIIPSEMKSDGLNYLESFNFINNEELLKFLTDKGFKLKDERIKKIWERCCEVIEESKALLRLFRKRNKDGSLTLIWQKFQEKRNKKILESKKITQEQRELLNKKLEEDEKLKEILAEENSIPVFYYSKYKKENKLETIVEIGGVVLILDNLKDGSKIWRIKKVYNVKGLKEGDVSDYEMNNFPVWVKNAALINGLIKKEKNE